MPSSSSPVGALTLPVAAGSAQERLADPILDALLDFAAWTIGTALDARLANLTGTSAVAVPATNRFAFNPVDPRGINVHLPVPALFCWWDGASAVVQHSLVRLRRERTLRLLYVFDELPHTDQLVLRAGLFAACDAALAQAASRGRHPSYSYGGRPAGTPLIQSVGAVGSWAWGYAGGQAVERFAIDNAERTGGRKRVFGRDWPAFAASFVVHERVDDWSLVDPTDVWPQVTHTIQASDGEQGEDAGTVEIMQRIAPSEPQE